MSSAGSASARVLFRKAVGSSGSFDDKGKLRGGQGFLCVGKRMELSSSQFDGEKWILLLCSLNGGQGNGVCVCGGGVTHSGTF